MKATLRPVCLAAFALAFLLAPLPAASDEEPVPTVTLIIDDLGYGREQARRTLSLPRPLAVAVLPDGAYAREIAESATRNNVDLLLHLPMQGNGAAHANHWTVRLEHDQLDVEQIVHDALAAVPGAIAINNHEGSVLTEDPDAMGRVMDTILEIDPQLLFIDSRTTADSVAERSAHAAGLGTTSRNVFLDHDRTPAAIESAVELWVSTAEQSGCALAIGHPHPETLSVLAARLPEVDLRVERVDLQTYVSRCGSPAQSTSLDGN